MAIEIKQLRKRDFNAARRFAIEGMHLTWYTSNRLELYLYSKYFWHLEISRATRALGAYMGDSLAGVLLVDINNQPKVFPLFWRRFFVKFASFIINLGYKCASGTYDGANKELLKAYRENNNPDGELNFIADANGGYDWIVPSGDSHLNTEPRWSHEQFLEHVAVVVMGKRCYDQQMHMEYKNKRYREPKPPFNWSHRYQFNVYVLDSTLDLPSNSRKRDLLWAMQGHILQQGSLVGRFR